MTLGMLIFYIFEVTVMCIALEIFRPPDEKDDD